MRLIEEINFRNQVDAVVDEVWHSWHTGTGEGADTDESLDDGVITLENVVQQCAASLAAHIDIRNEVDAVVDMVWHSLHPGAGEGTYTDESADGGAYTNEEALVAAGAGEGAYTDESADDGAYTNEEGNTGGEGRGKREIRFKSFEELWAEELERREQGQGYVPRPRAKWEGAMKRKGGKGKGKGQGASWKGWKGWKGCKGWKGKGKARAKGKGKSEGPRKRQRTRY